MTAVVFHRPANTLAKLVQTPGGVTVGQALTEAAASLEALKPRAQEQLTERLERLLSLGAVLTDPPVLDQVDTVYDLAEQILSIAETAGAPDAGQAALRLCELLDGLRVRETWSVLAVSVHLDALRLTVGEGASAAERQAVVAGLRQVAARVLREPTGAVGTR